MVSLERSRRDLLNYASIHKVRFLKSEKPQHRGGKGAGLETLSKIFLAQPESNDISYVPIRPAVWPVHDNPSPT